MKTIKKCVLLFLFAILIMIAISSILMFSNAEDYSALGEDDLVIKLQQIFAELDSRQYNDDQLMFDYTGLKIYFDYAIYDGIDHDLIIYASAINQGDRRISVSNEYIDINGWKVNTNLVVDLNPGEKEKLEIKIYNANEKAEIRSKKDLKEIYVSFRSYDPDTNKVLTRGLEGKTVLLNGD